MIDLLTITLPWSVPFVGYGIAIGLFVVQLTEPGQIIWGIVAAMVGVLSTLITMFIRQNNERHDRTEERIAHMDENTNRKLEQLADKFDKLNDTIHAYRDREQSR